MRTTGATPRRGRKIRNPNIEIRNKSEKFELEETIRYARSDPFPLSQNSELFRISCFGFRIFPLHFAVRWSTSEIISTSSTISTGLNSTSASMLCKKLSTFGSSALPVTKMKRSVNSGLIFVTAR